MKAILALVIAILGWFAVIAQYVLLVNNTEQAVDESTIQFFSYFTILTNILVSYYFTRKFLILIEAIRGQILPGALTAVTVYIFIVGLLYQVLLRHLWKPEGMQFLVDELLHSIIPILVVIYWALYENRHAVSYTHIFKFLPFPLIYCFLVLIRGQYSGFYPYPFIDGGKLTGMELMRNIGLLLLFFLAVSFIFVFIKKRQTPTHG